MTTYIKESTISQIMKKAILIGFLTLFFCVSTAEARSGCCSYHQGVRADGCGCNDGSPLSSTCAPYYTCTAVEKTITYPTSTPYPTVRPTEIPTPTSKPTPTATITPTPKPTGAVKKTVKKVAKPIKKIQKNFWQMLFGL